MEVALIVGAGVLGGLAAFVVTWAFLGRRKADAPATDIDALAVEVERVGRAVRRLTMQRLRQDSIDAQQAIPPLQPAAAPALVNPKEELRRRVNLQRMGGNS